MRILFTNITLATRSGTEIVVRDLSLGLAALGHEPVVFTAAPGPIAEEIRAAGVQVIDDLHELAETPDIIHGHHHVETTLAMLRFPSTPAIFVCHDRFIWHDIAPQSPQIRRYVAVDRNCLERLESEGEIPRSKTRLIHNAVDIKRFASRPPLASQPKRALVFSNYATAGTHLEPVMQACATLQIPVDVVGSGVHASSAAPERVLPAYDLVFAKARCALEAMAVGNAVILCDTRGLGPLVKVSNAATLRDWNFGMRCLQDPLNPGAIVREILGYNADDARAVSSWIRETANLDIAIRAYIELYEEVLYEARGHPIRVTLPDVLRESIVRMGGLENKLRLSGRFSTTPLPEMVANHTSLRSIERVRSFPADGTQRLMVELENASSETLASVQPYPVMLAYHWLDPISGEMVVFGGHRTSLTINVGPGSVHRQLLTVQAPPRSGRFLLRLTVVQELVRWFESVNPAVAADLLVEVTSGQDPEDKSQAAGLTSLDLLQTTRWVSGLTAFRNGFYSNVGFVSRPCAGMLTFVASQRYARDVLRSGQITCVITTPALAAQFPQYLGIAVADDPEATFFEIHNYLAAKSTFYWQDFQTIVDPTAQIDPGTRIPEWNVVIGPGVSVAPNVTIGERVFIGAHCTVHPGAVLGAEGFQTNRSAAIPQDMIHAGGVRIGMNSKIFANAVVARAVFREFTEIGRNARIGNGAFISHNVHIGSGSFVGHGAVVNGNVNIGDHAWIGPNATITDSIIIGPRAHISLGATVIRDVDADRRVIGAVADDTHRMLRSSRKRKSINNDRQGK